MATGSNFVTTFRQNVIALLNTVAACRDSDLHWQAEAEETTLKPTDLTGTNADVSTTDISNAMVSVEAILSLLSATGNAHYTNLMKMRY